LLKNTKYTLISSNRTNSKDLILLKDNDGYLYSVTIDNFLINIKRNSEFKKFYSTNMFVLDNIELYLKNNNKDFKLLKEKSKYNNIKEKFLYFYCNKCKDIWNTNLDLILNGAGCPYCSGNRVGKYNNLKYKFQIISNEFNYNKNNKKPENYTYGTREKVWWKCKDCAYEWKASVYSRTLLNSGCPKCSKDSKGELKIQKFLDLNNIIYEPQYIFKECKDKRALPFDFAIFKDKRKTQPIMLIEYDGQGHYFPVNFKGISDNKAIDNFNKTKKHDNIKNHYCKQNNIFLLRIPYWDFSNIENILIKELIKCGDLIVCKECRESI
jgi:hypothetical protein